MGEGKSLGNPNRKGCLQASRNGLDPSSSSFFMSGSLPAGVPRSLKPFRRVM